MSWNPGNEQIILGRIGPGAGPFLLISGTAYFQYVGYVEQAFTPQFVEGVVTTTGSGAQTAECGLFSSTTPPNKANITLAKIVAGTMASLTAVAPYVCRNNAAFATLVPSGIYLWMGIRTAMAGNQPTLGGAGGDFGQGFFQQIVGSGVLTGAGPFAGIIPALAIPSTLMAPGLRVSMV